MVGHRGRRAVGEKKGVQRANCDGKSGWVKSEGEGESLQRTEGRGKIGKEETSGREGERRHWG